MDNLERAAEKRDTRQRDLEKTIIELIQEHYRLMGKVVYEPIENESDGLLQNSSRGKFEWN